MTPLEEIQAAKQMIEDDAKRRRYMPAPVKFMINDQVYERLAEEGVSMESFERPVT